jgi:hypothetical protein
MEPSSRGISTRLPESGRWSKGGMSMTGRAGFRVYRTNLAFDFRAEGGWIAARFSFTNSLLMDGLRGGFEVTKHDHAAFVAEDRQDDGLSLHRA